MAANVSVYSTLLLSTLWLIGLDINLFLLVLVPFVGVNAACVTSSFPSSADYGAPSPTDSIYTSVSLPDYGEVDVLRIGDSRQHNPRAAVPSSSVDDSSTPTFHLPAIVMTPFSILPIIGYTILALLLTYLGLRLLRRFNVRLLPTFLSSDKDRIPQPVTSASGRNWGFGKGWSWSLNVFRRSFKGPNATTPTKPRHRPADLDLQSVELLPTSSRAKDGQLIDISSSTTASTITGVKLGVYADSSNVGSADAEQFHPQHLHKDIGEGRHLSRSSSVDAFPQFSSSSNPFAVFDTPVKSHTVPSTPPLTNTSSNSTYPSPFTPPSVSSFHLHSPSPFIPQVATASKSTLNPFKFSVLGSSRPPSPSLSLSISPLSKHRRSKSLGGVPLKRLGSSIKGKEKQRDEILVDYSSSGSSSQESASDPPPSSLTSSDVGTQRILPEPIAISHSRSEGSYLYGPLVPLPVPLVDVDMPEPMSLGPTGTTHIWAFDVDVEDRRTDFMREKLVDVSDNESNNGADVEDGRLLDAGTVKHIERLVDVSEDERENIPLISIQKSLIEREEKLVDVESATPVHISPVHSPPRSPIRTEREEPKLIDVSDHEDIDVEAQQEEQESWNWDEDPELDPWTQPADSSELISWDEKHAEEETTMVQAINVASASTTEVTEQEAVTEPAIDFPSEQSSDGLDDVQAVAAVPVEEAAETSVDISTDVSAAQATVSIAENPPALIVSDETPASSAAGELSVSSPELPCFKITLEGPGSPDAEIGVCLVPPTPMIHPVEDLDEDYIPQDVLEKLNVLQSRAPSPSESDEDTPLTKTNDIHDHNDTPITAPILELPPLSIPLITISSEVHQSEESEGVPDPDLLPLPELPSVPLTDSQPCEKEESPKEPLSQTPTPPASPPMSVMRSIPSSPRKEKDSSRPAWSLRAADAPALGLASAQSSPSMKPKSLLPMTKEMTISSPIEPSPTAIVPTLTVIDLSTSLPGTFPESVATSLTVPEPTAETSADLKVISSDAPVKVSAKAASTAVAAQPGLRRRMPRSPIDIALAMQLRPGLGVGADPAWMVRFLMTMFGWFAVLISGGGEF